MRRLAVLLLLAAVAALAAAASSENALTFTVPAGGRECFYETVRQGDRLAVEFQVLGGGHLDVDYALNAPSGRVRLVAPPRPDGG